MKQLNTKKEKELTPEKKEGLYDVILSELKLGEQCRCDSGQDKEQVLISCLKKIVEERDKLFDISHKMENDPRIMKFVELLIGGNNGKVALDGAGLSEFLEEMPLDQAEIAPLDVTKELVAFYKEKDMTKEVAGDFIAFVETFVLQVCQNEVDRNILEVLWLAFMYENDTKKFYNEGLLKGQNKKIESLRFERGNVDGLGPVGGGAISNPQDKKLGYIERILKNTY